MRPFIHARSAATLCSTSLRAVTPFVRFAFGKMTRFSLAIRSWPEARTVSVCLRRKSSSCEKEHRSIGSPVPFDGRRIQTAGTRSGGLSIRTKTHTCIGTWRQTTSVGGHPAWRRVYTIGEMIIGCYRRRRVSSALCRKAFKKLISLTNLQNNSKIVAATDNLKAGFIFYEF